MFGTLKNEKITSLDRSGGGSGNPGRLRQGRTPSRRRKNISKPKASSSSIPASSSSGISRAASTRGDGRAEALEVTHGELTGKWSIRFLDGGRKRTGAPHRRGLQFHVGN